jgi:hypothetical protein
MESDNSKEERTALIAQLKAEVMALKQEEREINEYLAKIHEKQVRLREILGSGFSGPGIKQRKFNEYKNAHYPVYQKDTRGFDFDTDSTVRIVYVDDKWVYTKTDRIGAAVNRFNIKTGIKAGTRPNQRSPDQIDIEKALNIWAAFGPEIPDFYKPSEKK